MKVNWKSRVIGYICLVKARTEHAFQYSRLWGCRANTAEGWGVLAPRMRSHGNGEQETFCMGVGKGGLVLHCSTAVPGPSTTKGRAGELQLTEGIRSARKDRLACTVTWQLTMCHSMSSIYLGYQWEDNGVIWSICMHLHEKREGRWADILLDSVLESHR